MSDLTEAQQAALDDYWAATTPAEEKAAYARMMALGMPDAYAPYAPSPPFWKVTETDGRPTTEGAKLYVYQPGDRPSVVLWQRGSWYHPDQDASLCTPYCWANLEDIPSAPTP